MYARIQYIKPYAWPYGTPVLCTYRYAAYPPVYFYYSKSPSHKNRLAGGSQSISKFLREIEQSVSQFLNVHGKFSESRVSIGLYLLCSITSGARCLSATIDRSSWRSRFDTPNVCFCDDRSILVAVQVRYA
jgi:hypothetical protein